MAFKWFKKNKTITPAVEPGKESPPAAQTPAAHQMPDSAEQKGPSLPEASAPREGGFFSSLKKGLAKTRKILTTDVEDLFSGKKAVDDEMLEELEERLITSDMGVSLCSDLIQKISRKKSLISGPKELRQVIKEEILKLFLTLSPSTQPSPAKPHVVMVVGVNGVGKTTTIGKLAAKAVADGKKVMIAAADTFRAAAVEQLVIWANRAGAEIIRHKPNADPAAVAYAAAQAAQARAMDVVLVDTAGRLHTKVNLMEELKKIQRTLSKLIVDAPHEILLVLDATTGQNALSQAKLFNEALGITGLALTKLDGTAKGGIVIAICTALNLPLKYIGVGEQIEDLQDFDPVQFVNALLGEG
jgi:fused signal recognition particle receptor